MLYVLRARDMNISVTCTAPYQYVIAVLHKMTRVSPMLIQVYMQQHYGIILYMVQTTFIGCKHVNLTCYPERYM